MSTDHDLDQPWYTQRTTHTVFMTHSGSSDSISTTATAPNLPGTGRVIGLAYDALGKVLVKRINRLAYRFRGKRHDSVGMGGVEPSTNIESWAIDAGSMLTVSTFSTTATQANLPGAGRVLGLAYDAVGKIIEKRLNKMADKLQRGPNATAEKLVKKQQQIRANYRHPSTSQYIGDVPDSISAKDKKALLTLCKRLLKYAKSDVLSTKLHALTKITNLTVHEPYFHILLSDLDAATVLSEVHFDLTAFRDLDPVIRTASEHALVAVSEVNVVALNLNIRAMVNSFESETTIETLKVSLSNLFSYITDAPTAFLVFRLFAVNQFDIAVVFDKNQNSFVIATLVKALSTVIDSTTKSGGEMLPEAICWPDLDSVVRKGLETWGPKRGSAHVCEDFGKLMRFAFRYSALLPETITFLTSTFDTWWSDAHLQESFLTVPFYLWTVIEEDLQSVDLYKLSSQQLSFTTTMNMLVSEACLSLIKKLVNPAVLALRQAVLEHQRWRADPQTWRSEKTGILGRVVPRDIIRAIVKTVLPLLTCEDVETRNRAEYSLAVIGQIDFYYWSETTSVLKEQRLASLVQPLAYPARGAWGVQYIFRTRCVNEDTHEEAFTIRHATFPLLFKVRTARQRESCPNCHELFERHTWLQLSVLTTDVLWYEVGSDLPFDRNLHYPLQIGENKDRETVFLGATFPYDGPFALDFAKLRAISSREMEGGKWFSHMEDRLGVLVLRFDPNAYADAPHPITQPVEGACYWTGPFFWRPFQM